jgi:two-component system, response regulator PdtaR
LIVEDEFLIRMDAVDMIRAVGFDVVDAANAYEAILSSKITKQALTD